MHFCYFVFLCILSAGDDEELMTVLPQGHSAPPIDLLSDPVPSCVPSPELHPQPQRPPSSLMNFDSVSRNPGQSILPNIFPSTEVHNFLGQGPHAAYYFECT